MDLATLLGLVVSLGLVGYAIFLGGNVAGFIDIPSILIVICGTFTVTLISFSATEMSRAILVILKAFFNNLPSPDDEARRMIQLIQKARKAGLLSLQKDAAQEQESFLQQGLALAVDGAPAELIDKVLKADTLSMLERHQQGIQVLKKASETAPAMGLIGTLIGLVQMLGNLAEPDKIGPAMAVAILTTFYGAIMAYMVLTPLVGKLERNSAEELMLRKIYSMSAIAIAKLENPRQLELQLNSILPPSLRISALR